MNQKVCVGILRRFFDIPPAIANNGLEGIEAVRLQHYDCIVMDVQARHCAAFAAAERALLLM